MRRTPFFLALAATASMMPSLASAALSVSATSPNEKVRPTEQPTGASSIALEAARNEFEAFQIVLAATSSDATSVSAKLVAPLSGAAGTIPAANVVLYAERYYDVAVASNDEGAPGLWPDPLVPDVDTYFGEKRDAFPITVPAGQSRAIWVDVLVPIDQAPGDYAGAIEVDVGGASVAQLPIALHVGTFTLPSTASLASAFGMGWNTPPLVHCGGSFPYCGGDADASNAIRALYLRAALEHRFTISDTDFQPPLSGTDQTLWEKHVLPLVNGTAPTRLPGAKLTAVRLDGGDSEVAQWIAYAKGKGFFDRLLYYPVDEPGADASAWAKFTTSADALHAADMGARILITSSIQDADAAGATSKIDLFIPVIDELENRPGSGTYAGDQRAKYDAWLAGDPKREIWAYQSCDEHGCGACHDPSPGVAYTGWPNRVIDSSAVQDRAFPWQAFRFRLRGELYFETTFQLATAWSDDGQCAFSGSGDGTLFYPGKPSVIGGTKDIPIESIRMKMIREGMEDYEYLALVAAKKGDAAARAIADALFPHAYASAQSAAALEAARHQLFTMLDQPAAQGDAGADAALDAGSDASDATTSAGDALAPAPGSSCGCRTAATTGGHADVLALAAAAAALARRRRRA